MRLVSAPRAIVHPTTIAALALVLGLSGVAPNSATNLTVTTAVDSDLPDADCSLREALIAANTDSAYNGCVAGVGADRIVFALATPATIALVADLPVISTSLTLQGPGATDLEIDGQDLHQLLVFDSPTGGEWLGVENLTLTRGLAANHGGGALIAPGETAYFHRVIFFANQSTNGGGGMAVDGDDLEPAVVAIDECWFSANRALGPTGAGGLLAIGPMAEVTIDRTTFSGNGADHQNGTGGGITVNRASVQLTRSTVSGNFANSSGGGIYLTNVGALTHLTIHDSTITGNQAEANGDGAGEGGGLHVTVSVGLTATLEIRNSILAGNLDSGVQTWPDVSAFSGLAVTSLGFNLIGSNEGAAAFFPAGSPNAHGDFVGSVGALIDPFLDALAVNGGFGPDHRPSANPATTTIDKGICPGVGSDQRGYGDPLLHIRIVDTLAANGAGSDACDIGAHERGGDPAAEPSLFADDFEAGNTLYWSSEMP